MPGKRSGLTRLILNILLSGLVLLVKSIAPSSPCPHHRLCLPKEICQLARFMPTYASSRRNRLTAAKGIAGGSAGRRSSLVMKFSAAAGNDGADGAD